MAEDILNVSDEIFAGNETIASRHPVNISTNTTAFPLADDVLFLESFANVVAFQSAGRLLLVDAGGILESRNVYDRIREWTDAPLEVAIYTHGHVDHVFSVPHFEEENHEIRPRVIAHENVAARFDRYQLTQGYNAHINQRQFQLGAPLFPNEFRYPDETYQSNMSLRVGDLDVELFHDKGETDDATWVWVPSKRILCTGDMFIWAAPNCGNPQKVQRYPAEWAAALRKMAALRPTLLLPGHGIPIAGEDRIQHVLTSTARYLESLVEQTIALMNTGARLNDIIQQVTPPEDLLDQPYLAPVYDEPEFIIRNLWRLYGGWYDGNPAHLKPAPDEQLARELAELVGGARVLAERAVILAEEGEHRLAGHLIEFAAQADPDDLDIQGVRATVFGIRKNVERSTMAKGVYAWAQKESSERSD